MASKPQKSETRTPTGRGGLGPLIGGRVAIIGGGPGGACTALTLVRMAKARGRAVEVILFEPKDFVSQYNQCSGVLSPPILSLLKQELDLTLPPGLLQREITGYVLYGESECLDMSAQDHEDATFAVRRVQFDRFLLEATEKADVQVKRSRVYDIEFGARGVTLYSDGGSWEADVVVGAFGLDRTIGQALARRTAYRMPPTLDTIVTRIHPGGLEHIPALLGDRIHAFLPSLSPIEFGAIIPKGNHITIIVAGRGVGVAEMQALDDRFSNEKHLWWREAKPGDKLIVGFKAPSGGTKQIIVRLTKAGDYGIVQLYVNDEKAGKPIDLYHDGGIPADEIDLGRFQLKPGENPNPRPGDIVKFVLALSNDDSTQQTGKSFLQHLCGWRMEEAKRLLGGSLLPVGRIAEQVGYDNPRYFSEVFQRHCGKTPSQYRKSCRA